MHDWTGPERGCAKQTSLNSSEGEGAFPSQQLVTWGPLLNRHTDKHDWKHYIPQNLWAEKSRNRISFWRQPSQYAIWDQCASSFETYERANYKGPFTTSISVNAATTLPLCSRWNQWSHSKMGCNPLLEWLHCFQWEQNHIVIAQLSRALTELGDVHNVHLDLSLMFWAEPSAASSIPVSNSDKIHTEQQVSNWWTS